MKNKWARKIVLLLTASLTFVGSGAASASTSTTVWTPDFCTTWFCTGYDPSLTFCVDDALTVASIGVWKPVYGYVGQLDLRYSPRCQANWGRFTLAEYNRRAFFFRQSQLIVHSARVTVWNPGEESQPEAGRNGRTYWTRMVDGSKTACTGVELYHSTRDPNSMSGGFPESLGWVWGPCV